MNSSEIHVNMTNVWYNYHLTPLQGKDVYGVLDDGYTQLDEHKWIDSGTLIGLYRDGKYIDHDTDIDVNITRYKDNKERVKLEGFDLALETTWQDYPMQSAFIKNDIIFDVYYFYTGIEKEVAVNYNMEGIIHLPMKYVDQLQDFAFKNKVYRIPNHIQDYMVWRFGHDWQTPKKNKIPWQEEATHLQRWTR